MSTGIFNFNLQANVSTLRTGNSWSVSNNLSPRFNSYPEMNQLLSVLTPSLPTDAVKNISSNVLYTANTSGVFQFFYESNNVVGSIYPASNHYRLSLPVNDVKSIDISPDGAKLFVMDSYGLVSSANLSSAWNVATAIGAVSGNTWMKSKQSGQTHSDYYMREDGNKFYIINNNGTIEQYSLSNGDFRTAQVEHISSSFGTGSGYGYFNDSGDRLFYLRGGLSNITWIAQYNLSESWNINSASFVTDFAPIDVGGGLYSGSGMRLSQDGLNVYYSATSASNSTRYLHRLQLSNSYNLSSRIGSYTERYASDYSMFEFKDDGTQLYLLSGSLRSYNLSTPWSLSSVTTNTSISAVTRGPIGAGLSMFSNGSKLVLGSNTSNTVHSAYMSPWNISTLTFYRVDDNFLDTKPTVTTNSNTYMRIGADSSNIIVFSNKVFYNYRMSSNLDLSSATLFGSKDLSANIGNSAHHFTIDNTGTTIYQVGVFNSDGTVYKRTMSSSWNIASLVSTNEYKDVTSNSASGIRVLISSPQTKFTIIDEDSRVINFTQPTTNNIITATYTSNGTGFFSSSRRELNPGYGLKFSNDGTFFFTNQGNTVYINRLSRPWDISTVISTGTRYISTSITSFKGFSISRNGRYLYYIYSFAGYIDRSELKRPSDYVNDSYLPITSHFGLYFDSSMYDMEFSNNGTRLLVSSVNGIQSFDNSATPWLPDGSTLPNTLVSGTGQAMPFAASRNGKFLYVPYNTGDNLYVRRYTLTTPWIGPATLTQDILIPNAKNWSVYGIALDISGNILYLLDSRSKTVFSYNMGA